MPRETAPVRTLFAPVTLTFAPQDGPLKSLEDVVAATRRRLAGTAASAV